MKSKLLPIIAVIFITFGVLWFSNRSDKKLIGQTPVETPTQQPVYQTQNFSPGEYLIFDRNYFEDAEDFTTHVCLRKNLAGDCAKVSTLSENKFQIQIVENAMDDSIATVDSVYLLELGENPNKFFVSRFQNRWTCHEFRGPVGWTVEKCF